VVLKFHRAIVIHVPIEHGYANLHGWARRTGNRARISDQSPEGIIIVSIIVPQGSKETELIAECLIQAHYRQIIF
jgi:hypothetical protein